MAEGGFIGVLSFMLINMLHLVGEGDMPSSAIASEKGWRHTTITIADCSWHFTIRRKIHDKVAVAATAVLWIVSSSGSGRENRLYFY